MSFCFFFFVYFVTADSRPSHLCDQCGKGYYSQSRLATHFLSHEDPKIKCPDCPQLFRTKNALDKHSYLHRDEKFVCSICGAERSSPGALRRHLRKLNSVSVNLSSYFNLFLISTINFQKAHMIQIQN